MLACEDCHRAADPSDGAWLCTCGGRLVTAPTRVSDAGVVRQQPDHQHHTRDHDQERESFDGGQFLSDVRSHRRSVCR
jgi:hypothetical protein